MASTHSRAPRAGRSKGADDFRLINGIGPAVESRLHSAGILTFAQLAALSPDDIAALVVGLTGLSAERIVKQDWIGQARELAAEMAPEPQPDEATPADRQHYATFTVELLLDEDNNVRRTRITHVQSGVEDTWVEWQEVRLVDFFVQRAALRLPLVEQYEAVTTVEPAPPVAATTRLVRVLSVPELQTMPADVDVPRKIVRYGQPFNVRLTLDLTDVAAPSDELLFTAVIYAKSLSDHSHQIAGEARGTVTAADRVIIDVEGTTLRRGIYRLEGSVTLALPAMEPSWHPDIRAHVEGSLLYVY
jgi:hypothetical protein